MFVEISLTQKVFDTVLTDEWRSHFYNLHTREQVAEHLAFNLMQGRSLESLDGFAELSPMAAILGTIETDGADETLEKKPKKKAPAAKRRKVKG